VVYALATQAVGARAIVVPARDFGHDFDAMRAAIEPDTRLVFIANPNNPTGTFAPAQAIEAFLASVPPDVVVVLDEAYNEYLDPALRFDSTQWVRRFPNLILSRTLSKAYGLAGLRVGFALAQPELTDLMNRIRQPFNVNSLALRAAVAALGDQDFVARSREQNAAGMRQIQEGLSALGLSWIPSRGNFLAIDLKREGLPVYEALLRQGVIVRPVANYGMPNFLRVTIGSPSENERFLAALRTVLA
jgi:histidinol-phosphate aminotransferase